MGTYEKARKKTQHAIRAAFWELYGQKTIDKISVQEIANGCGIHRATFYIHYHDVYAVLEDIERTLLDSLERIRAENPVRTESDLDAYAGLIYTAASQNTPYLQKLVLEARDPSFAKLYVQKLKDILPTVLETAGQPLKIRAAMDSIQTFLVELLLQWILVDCLSMEQIIRLTKGIMFEGIYTAFHAREDGTAPPSSGTCLDGLQWGV